MSLIFKQSDLTATHMKMDNLSFLQRNLVS